MLGSAIFYSGLVLGLLGFLCLLKPLRLLRIRTRRQALAVAAVGGVVAGAGLVLPAPETRVLVPRSQLDRAVPVWQFHEVHALRIAAPPERVFAAIRQVRADEIFLFQALTWIRRGGRPLPKSILNAGARAPLLDVATRSGFVYLADDPPRELVVGTAVLHPPGVRGALTPEVFRRPLPPGFALAAMSFAVRPDGPGGSLVSTETRVYANSPAARRRFAAYWRAIYPCSALIRRMWLRAIARRATTTRLPLSG